MIHRFLLILLLAGCVRRISTLDPPIIDRVGYSYRVLDGGSIAVWADNQKGLEAAKKELCKNPYCRVEVRPGTLYVLSDVK